LDNLRDELAARHSVYDPDARRRLLRLLELAQDWVSVLATRGRSLEELLARSRNLICGTCVGIGRRGIQLEKNAFDLVIIDEAARCTPSELAVGMQSPKRLVLVGDQRQLPPLFDYDLLKAVGPRLGITSQKELRRSDFERAFQSDYGRAILVPYGAGIWTFGDHLRHLAAHAGHIPLALDEFGRCVICIRRGFFTPNA
jgi:hypothetical protein